MLVHSVGVHPDFGVVGILRASLADMGYTTLSIQLPVQGREATAGYAMPILDVYGEQDYGPTLGSAARRRFALKQSNGPRQVMIAAAHQNYTGRERDLAAAINAFLGAIR